MNQLNQKKISEGEKAVEEYRTYWKTLESLPPTAVEKILLSLDQQEQFQEFARFEKAVKILFDQTHFKIVYITDSVEAFSGYTAQDFMSENTNLFFNIILSEHLDFALKATQFTFEAKERIGIEPYKKNRLLIVCGIKAIKKNGQMCRLLIKFNPLEVNELAVCQTALITIEDVTFLMKSDFYWGRTSFGDNKEYKFHFISDVEKDIKNDIISDREKDVLRLLANGMESKEIAKELFISSGTVDNHRKNMIARTGARDTTALLQLCLSCGII